MEEPFAPQSKFEGVLHGDNLTGDDQRGAGMRKILERLGQTNQKQMGVGMALQKLAASRERDAGTVITTHTVDSKRDHGAGALANRKTAELTGIKTKARRYRCSSFGPGLAGRYQA